MKFFALHTCGKNVLIVLRNRPHVIYVTPSSKGIYFVDYLYVNVLSFFHMGPILAHFHNKVCGKMMDVFREDVSSFFLEGYAHFIAQGFVGLSARTVETLGIANGMGSNIQSCC